MIIVLGRSNQGE